MTSIVEVSRSSSFSSSCHAVPGLPSAYSDVSSQTHVTFPRLNHADRQTAVTCSSVLPVSVCLSVAWLSHPGPRPVDARVEPAGRVLELCWTGRHGRRRADPGPRSFEPAPGYRAQIAGQVSATDRQPRPAPPRSPCSLSRPPVRQACPNTGPVLCSGLVRGSLRGPWATVVSNRLSNLGSLHTTAQSTSTVCRFRNLMHCCRCWTVRLSLLWLQRSPQWCC